MLSYEKCNLCPRQCGVNRKIRQGACGVFGSKIRVGRAMLHKWEEPCISGANGSGAIFFSGCSLGCIYCQNQSLSRQKTGVDITVRQLTDVMLRLQDEGAHNINFVTPTHYVPDLLAATHSAAAEGFHLPIVYNTSGYETPQTVRALQGTVDIFLTDFKYFDNLWAQRYSGVSDYVEYAKAALAQMVRQTGRAEFDQNGLMRRGVIVRHLMLPGHTRDSEQVLRYLRATYGDDIYISLLNQYTPLSSLKYENLNRTISPRMYERMVDFACMLGIKNGFIQQEGTQKESFIPSFNGEGVL